MAIVNRDLETSEQRVEVSHTLGLITTGTTIPLFAAPYPCVLEAVKLAPIGISGAPEYAFQINRFVIGAGATAIPVVATAAYDAFGTSGLVSVTLPTSGSTLLSFVAGDVLEMVTGAADSAFTTLTVSAQFKKTQDILSFFNA